MARVFVDSDFPRHGIPPPPRTRFKPRKQEPTAVPGARVLEGALRGIKGNVTVASGDRPGTRASPHHQDTFWAVREPAWAEGVRGPCSWLSSRSKAYVWHCLAQPAHQHHEWSMLTTLSCCDEYDLYVAVQPPTHPRQPPQV